MRCHCAVMIGLLGFLTLGVSAAWAGPPSMEIVPHVEGYYTSNLFHVTKEQEDQFDTRNEPGERFYRMAGPADFVTSPGLDLTWRWDVGKKRDLELSIGADYYFHARNSIANYLRVGGALAYDLTRQDKLGLKADFIPDRFRKNLSLEDPVTHDKIFDRADYRQFRIAPRYIHDWSKDWSTGLEYEFCNRDYEDPFNSRDRVGHTVTALVGYSGFKRTDINFRVGLNTTKTPTDTEFGIEVDRSFNEVILGVGVDFALPQHWKAKIGTEYWIRDYTTDVQADDTYFDRRDNLWEVKAELGKKFHNNLYMALQAGYAHRNSNRSDPTIEPDEVGYTEYTVGLVAEWPF